MIPQLRRGAQQTAGAMTVLAPIRGINATSSLANMDAEECIYTFNLLPKNFGMEMRPGYREYANGWTGDEDANTVIAFEGSNSDNSADRLWVANRQGIWDCTVRGTTIPVQVVVWPDNGTGAGSCSYVTYVNDEAAQGGDRGFYFLLLCDERNGYWVYSQETDLWTEITQGSGPFQVDGSGVLAGDPEYNPRNFVFVMSFKERLWFIRKDSGEALYLDFGAFQGELTRFVFGKNFRSGGNLQSMYNWTLDGGRGIDNYMVALSESGDLVIYQGTDPDQASEFGLKGVWNIGQTPKNRRQGVDFGGEVYLLSVFGLLPLSQVLKGASINDPSIYLTYKIAPYLRVRLAQSITDPGWQVEVAPLGGSLGIHVPTIVGKEDIGFSFNFGTQGWGMSRNLQSLHRANWRGKAYFTRPGINKLWEVTGDDTADAIHLDPDADGPATVIEFSMLTAYQTIGDPARYKRVQYIRPMWTGGAEPTFDVQARYDFDLGEVLTSPPLAGAGRGSGVWDDPSSTWDLAIWGGSLQASDNPRGANGMGRHVAIAIRGRSSQFTTLVAFDVVSDQGGMM